MAKRHNDAVAFALKRLVELGCKIKTVDDGGEDDEWIHTDCQHKAHEHITSVDDAQLLIETPTGAEKWIRFILGNNPNEIICDYHSDPIIDKVCDEVESKFE